MLSTKWQKSFVGLSEQQIDKTLKVNQVVDMEWKFGGQSALLHVILHASAPFAVTASSSELAAVGSTFLQLKLVLDRGGSKEVRDRSSQ
jgi:hypothetical protein